MVLVCSVSDVGSVPVALFLRLSSCGLLGVRVVVVSVFCSGSECSSRLSICGRRRRMVVVVISVASELLFWGRRLLLLVGVCVFVGGFCHDQEGEAWRWCCCSWLVHDHVLLFQPPYLCGGGRWLRWS